MVIAISLITAVLSILHVIIGYFQTPPGMVYLWTGHYYLDYFQYVQSFAQGMQGKWLLDNPLTLEPTPLTFVGMWQNIILGKIAGIFGLTAIGAYWFFTFLFLTIFVFLIFKLIAKIQVKENFVNQICVLILVLFSTPFYQFMKVNDSWTLNYFSFWSDKGILWKRFDSIPYHLSANILTIVVILWFSKILSEIKVYKSTRIVAQALSISLVLIFILTFSPSSAVLLCLTVGVFNLLLVLKYIAQKRWNDFNRVLLFTLVIMILILPAAVLIRLTLDNSYYKIAFDFEKNWQIKLTLKQFFLVHGPLSVLAVLGLRDYFKNLTLVRAVFLVFIAVSYVIFFSPLASQLNTTNTRFLTPLSYVLFAALSLTWLKNSKTIMLVTALLFFFFLPVNIKAFGDILNDKNIFSPISYLPQDIIEGFKFIDKRKERGNVLLTPSQFLGTVLPIYANRKVYVARHLITVNYLEKNIRASNFYLRAMTDEQAMEFLRENDLKFVIFTSIEGYDVRQLLKYPFLEEIYRSKNIIIFKVKG